MTGRGHARWALAVAGLMAWSGPLAAQATDAALETAEALLDRDQADSALALLEPLLASPAASSRVLHVAATAYGRVADRKPIRGLMLGWRARRMLRRAVAAAPMAAMPRHDLAWALALLPWWAGGDRVEAEAHRDTLLARHPYRGALVDAGLLRVRGLGRAAAARLRLAIAQFPDSAEAHFQLADLLAEQGMAEAAAASYARYLALRPADRAARYAFARFAVTRGVAIDAAAEAVAPLVGAVGRTPGVPDTAVVVWRLGQLRVRQGRLDEARTLFERALAADPRDRDYRAALDSLR